MTVILRAKKYIKHGIFFSRLLRHISFTRKVYKLFNIIVPFIKVKPDRILCDHFSGRGYGDSPKYIAEELHKKHSEIEIYFLYDKEKCSSNDFPDFVNIVPIYSLKHLVILATSKFWIFDNRQSVHIYKKKTQFYIQTWHAVIGTKKSERDSENELPKSYVKNAIADSKQIDLCIAGSEQIYGFLKNSFWYKGEILNSGCPRSDILFDKQKTKEIRENLGFADKKICIYAPTFRNSHSLEVYKIDFYQLKNTLETKFGGEWIILLRLHPNMADVNLKNLPDFVKNYSLYNDVQKLLSASDILITDYSSIIYDFMLTERPAFIYASDFNDYKKERGLLIDLRETPFSIAQTNSCLQKNILDFDFNFYQKNISEFKTKVGSFDDGHASERVVKWIDEKQLEKNISKGGTLKR